MSGEMRKEERGGSFTYTYSSRRQAEVAAIRKKYLPKEEDAMERLRRLDRSVTKKGAAAAIALGTTGSLIMGTGMSMTMVWSDTLLIPGVIIGMAGMAGAAAAYPVYERITKRERDKIAPEILRLTEEMMK